MMQPQYPTSPDRTIRRRRHAFTLVELLVAVSILVVIILGIGLTFNGASRAVSLSQATMELMSNMRATQQLLVRDVSGMDKSAFLVIRCRMLDSRVGPTADPSVTFADISPRYDQVSFLSRGSFPNRTGADSDSPFTESTVANAAHVWWGHLIMEHSNAATLRSYVPPNQQVSYPQTMPPTGVYLSGGNLVVSKETDGVLGRHATILLAPQGANTRLNMGGPANYVMAYSSIDGHADNKISGTQEQVPAHISSSRYAVAAMTPSQVMQYANLLRANNTDPFEGPELLRFTYRFRALASVYDTELDTANPFVNGAFRMHPIVMQSVSSFRVEWTDGTSRPSGDLNWYGPGNPRPQLAGEPPVNAVYSGIGHPATHDHYVAVFNEFNRAYWPKALRFTIHVASQRLPGGRDFVQVVNLPQ